MKPAINESCLQTVPCMGCPQIEQCCPRLTACHVSHITVTLAKLRWAQPLALYALVQRGLELLPDGWQRGDLVWMAWALGKLQYQAAVAKKLLKGALEALQPIDAAGASIDFDDMARAEAPQRYQRRQQQQQRQQRKDAEASAQGDLGQLVTVLWACGRCQNGSRELQQRLLKRICRHPGRADARIVSNVAWACGRLGLGDADATAWIAREAEGCWHSCSMQALSNTSWGLWKLGGYASCHIVVMGGHGCCCYGRCLPHYGCWLRWAAL